MHEVTTSAYLIARHEVTFGEWIQFLDALPPAERQRRTPSAVSPRGALALRQLPDGAWQLTLRPTIHTYQARQGEPIRYLQRDRRAVQDWSRLPVAALSFDDAEAYAAWLDATGRVPGARLCDEHEWERAARGADGRNFPSGNALSPDDADFDNTYGRRPLAYGPDEVGAHPRSRSPFGIDDMAGNVWEWVRSVGQPNEIVYRGGSWYQGQTTSRSANREVGERTQRHPFHGVRMCATPRL
jgi:formylglycine-generating enzyme required for sulfatase activity